MDKKEKQIDTENFSVFDASPVKEPKGEEKKSGKLKLLISLFLCLLVLCGGLFAVIKFIPEDTAQTPSADSPVLPIISLKDTQVKSVTVSGENNITFLTTVSGEGDEASVTWTVEGIDPTLTSSSSISLLTDRFITFDAIRKIEKEDNADYGFASPLYTVAIKGYDDKDDVTLNVGSKTASDSGYYVTLDGETVYLADCEDIEKLSTKATDVATNIIISAAEDDGSEYFKDGTLSTFESISLSSANIDECEIVLNDNEKTSKYVPYVLKKPALRYANDTVVSELLAVAASGISGNGAYAFYPDGKTKAAFGLDKPDLRLYIKYSKEITLIASKQDDGYYAAMVSGNDDIIFKINESSLSFSSYTVDNLLSSSVFIEMLADLSEITLSTEDNSYTLAVSHDSETGAFSAMLGDTELKGDNLQNFYQYLVSVKPNETTLEKKTGTPALTVKTKYTDGSQGSSLVFIPHTDRRFYVESNGTPIGFISTTNMDKILDNLNRLVKGETVAEPY